MKKENTTTLRSYSALLIGSGKLARHLAYYFELKNIPLTTWNRSQSVETLQQLCAEASHIYLAVSDSAIEGIYHEHQAILKDKTVCHFSGALQIAGVFSAHPLMTFAGSFYSLEKYEKIPFALIDGEKKFHDLFPALNNPSFTLKAADKALYHALCVISGNFPQAMWKMVFDESEKIGLNSQYFKNYLHQCVENSVSSPQNSLTGPVVRGDLKTIDTNLNALENKPLQDFYSFFVEKRSSYAHDS